MLKNVIQALANRSATLLLQPISLILFARVLGPEQQGELAILLAVSLTTGQVSLAGLDVAVNYRVAKNPQGTQNALKVALIGLSCLLSFLALTSGFWMSALAAAGILEKPDPGTHALILLATAAQAYLALLVNYYIGRKQLNKVLAGGLAQQTVYLTSAAFVFFGLGPARLMAAHVLGLYTGAALLNLGLLWARLDHSSQPRNPLAFSDELRSQLSYGLPHYSTILVIQLQQRLDTFLIAALFPGYVLGNYSIAKSAAEVATVGPRAIQPLVTAEVASGTRAKKFAPFYLSIVLLMALTVVVCWLFARPMVKILLGPAFGEAAVFLPVLAAAAALTGLRGLICHHIYGLGSTVIRFRSELFALAATLPILIIGASIRSPMLIAVSLIAGGVCGTVLAFARLSRLLQGPTSELFRVDAVEFMRCLSRLKKILASRFSTPKP